MKKKYQTIFRIMFVIPFFLGWFGNYVAGLSWNNALYCSFCYYFVSVFDAHSPNIYTEVARWTAPLMTVTGLLYSLRGWLVSIKTFLFSMRKDAVVIYHDGDRQAAQFLSDNIPHSFLQEISEEHPGMFFQDVPRQILFFHDDYTNLDFYSKHLHALKNKQVYMKLLELDANLFKSNHVHYFNLLEAVANQYWKSFPILDKEKPEKREYHMAVIGNDRLTEEILMQAILHNIFFEEQKFVYHIFGEMKEWPFKHKPLNLMNQDEIIYEEKPWIASYEQLEKMDRIVLTDRFNENVLEKLIYLCPDVPKYYFTETSVNPGKFFLAENIYAFGSQKDVLTKENFLGDRLYQKAKDLHYLTVKKDATMTAKQVQAHKETEWLKLDGFMQCSYRALADYYVLYEKLVLDGYEVLKDLMKLVELEHVRWCRFYGLNHWTYGVPTNGALRDPEKRIHRSLVPYGQLCEEDIQRELERIQFLILAKEQQK